MIEDKVATAEAVSSYETPKFHPSLYLITDSDWKTDDGLRWGTDITHSSEKKLVRYPPTHYISLQEMGEYYRLQQELSNDKTYFRACTHPIIAALLRRVYFDSNKPVLWECVGNIKHLTAEKFAYCTELTTKYTTTFPMISDYTRMKFGFGCVSKVYKDKVFQEWILDWVGGKDRSKAKAQEVGSYVTTSIQKEMKEQESNYDLVGQMNAAHWMALAAIAFDDEEAALDHSVENKRYIEYWTGMAAYESSHVAKNMEMKDFDLVFIAEATMAAR